MAKSHHTQAWDISLLCFRGDGHHHHRHRRPQHQAAHRLAGPSARVAASRRQRFVGCDVRFASDRSVRVAMPSSPYSFTSFFFSQADPYYAGFRVAVKVQRFDHSFTVNRQQDQQLLETWLWRNLFQSNIPCPIPHDFCISHQAEPTKPANICQSI